jgi:hypothetical protein
MAATFRRSRSADRQKATKGGLVGPDPYKASESGRSPQIADAHASDSRRDLPADDVGATPRTAALITYRLVSYEISAEGTDADKAQRSLKCFSAAPSNSQ